MDARVNKQRLGNMLSYDWLKILCAIAAAVVALVLFFTMVRTRPTRAQKYNVHFYGGLSTGDDYSLLEDKLLDLLSYDILMTNTETFDSSSTSNAAYTARRSAGEGSVMFVANYTKPDSKGEMGTTPFQKIVNMGLGGGDDGKVHLNMFYEADVYFADCESYIERFFGANWRTTAEEIDEAEVHDCFYARNVNGFNNGHRYKTNAQIAKGLEDEKGRLLTLRESYLYVKEKGLDSGLLSYTYYSYEPLDKDGNVIEEQAATYCAGINIGRLTNIKDLAYYKNGDGESVANELNLLIYNNGWRLEDLKYETVTFLKYLIEKYS